MEICQEKSKLIEMQGTLHFKEMVIKTSVLRLILSGEELSLNMAPYVQPRKRRDCSYCLIYVRVA